MTKWVYSFGDGTAEGSAEMKNLLGGKGANLAEMCNLGLPVPPGFTITTEVCTAYYENDRTYPSDLDDQLRAALSQVEAAVGMKFGDAANPLLVSVRSGARASMPGMMDTVLNLGLNDVTVEGLAAASGDARFAYDSYRRFIQMYGDVVLGVDHGLFEELLDLAKDDKEMLDFGRAAGLDLAKDDKDYALDTDLTADDWRVLVDQYKAKVEEELGEPFPQDPMVQLKGAIDAVFGSWMNARAKTYRRLHDIPQEWGTAVNVQAMVFGNMGEDCATGVCFTRDPSTGANIFYGEYLVNAQGEDVVAGIRTPQYLTTAGKEAGGSDLPSMEEVMPKVFGELCAIRDRLENHYGDMQDMEFTVQKDKLWMLQTRAGKRTAQAALKIAIDMAREGIIDQNTAIRRVEPGQLDQLLHPTLDPKAPRNVILRGLPASPGAASGKIAFTADEAEERAQKGEKVILVRLETSPEDISGMHAAQGILTARGGMTSHAAVVARGMGRPCVAGAGQLNIDEQSRTARIGELVLGEGEIITLDGASGEVMRGEVPTIQPELTGDFGTLMEWVDAVRRLKVRTNAETPLDAATAIKFGAEGIGLCRTEHMFFEPARIVAVREMIVADSEKDRRKALDKILPYQREDFIELFRIMEDRPVTIRLLDPPLHEFLPVSKSEMQEVANAAGVNVDVVVQRAQQLSETNPMLGHRGCRLGISFPEIYEMQARAILEAALAVKAERGVETGLEIMIPLVGARKELDILTERVRAIAEDVFTEAGERTAFLVGTMIELPRACLQAADIAETAEFFSFGTNDLTQTTFGLSRDDSAKFLERYQAMGIYETDPFVSLDQEGVGELVKIAVERGRSTRPDIKLGICGEHGGDPSSVFFCHRIGLDYVSCSPYRVPVARLAAAHAALDDM